MVQKNSYDEGSITDQIQLGCPTRAIIRQYVEAMYHHTDQTNDARDLEQKIEQEVRSFFS